MHQSSKTGAKLLGKVLIKEENRKSLGYSNCGRFVNMKTMLTGWHLSRAQRSQAKNCKNNQDVFSVGRRQLMVTLASCWTLGSLLWAHLPITDRFLCQAQETQCSIHRHWRTRQVIQAAAEPCSQTGEVRNKWEHLGVPIWECVLNCKHNEQERIYPNISSKSSYQFFTMVATVKKINLTLAKTITVTQK